MGIKVITLFEINIGGELQKRSLDKSHLTALAIWLVEAINNPDTPPLAFRDDPFIWRVNPEKSEGYFKVSGCEIGMNLLEARDLLDNIDSLPNKEELLLDDTYPRWYDHPNQHVPKNSDRYQVRVLNGLLGYIDNNFNKPILPLALKLDDKNNVYRFVLGQKEAEPSPYYRFG